MNGLSHQAKIIRRLPVMGYVSLVLHLHCETFHNILAVVLSVLYASDALLQCLYLRYYVLSITELYFWCRVLSVI